MKRASPLLATFGLIAGLLLIAPGAVSAGASPEYFTAALSGAQNVPPITTAASGSATVVIDPTGTTVMYEVSYSGLSGAATASHIHLGAVGVSGGILLPLKVGPSPMIGSLTAADLVATGGVTTFAGALAAIRAGGTYVNLHTAANPGGEIRGQLTTAAHQPVYTITADDAAAVPAGHLWSFDDYFPRTSSVAIGSTILFDTQGFHTATLLPSSTTVAQDMATSSVASADTDDSAKNVNGTTKSTENIGPLMPVPFQGCGTVTTPCVFDGTGVVSMGAPLAGPPTPFAVTITAPAGTYTFHCRVHPLMTGTLAVVAAGSAGTTTFDSAAAASATQAASAVSAGMAAEAASNKAAVTTNPNGTRTWTLRLGTSTADGRVAILEFLPQKVTIKPGDTVVWRPLDRQEPHTVTFPGDLMTEALPMCEGPNGADTPAVPTVNPPTGPQDFGCNGKPVDEFEFGGGNGVQKVTTPKTVSDSGLVAYKTVAVGFGIPASAALSSWYVRFTGAKAGTYTYVCQIHDGMKATIVVH